MMISDATQISKMAGWTHRTRTVMGCRGHKSTMVRITDIIACWHDRTRQDMTLLLNLRQKLTYAKRLFT
jgi:hypothetical protein